MKRATEQQFRDDLAKHPGARLDESCADTDFHVDAPPGRIWRDNGLHVLTEPHTNESGQTWKAEARALLVARMRAGTDECTEPGCDVCRPVMPWDKPEK